MPTPAKVERAIRPLLNRAPVLRSLAKEASLRAARLEHSIAEKIPSLIQPKPRRLTIAVTAYCNLRCQGCRYGRDFMPGQQLNLNLVLEALDDAKAAGVTTTRFYGGEPMLHPKLPQMVEHSVGIGLRTYVTSNGNFLKQKIDGLYAAGLRLITIGFYGVGSAYNSYTQKSNFDRLVEGISAVRDRYGNSIELQLNFLVMRPSANPAAWHAAWEFSKRFDMYFHLDLVSYNVPFFDQNCDLEMQFRNSDQPILNLMTEDFLRFKDERPDRFAHSREFIRSVPDWLLKQAAMRIPCDAYLDLWIGADGTVQLCDTAFTLGNLHEGALSSFLFTEPHRKAARDAFQLNCPNCICHVEHRIQKHAPSVKRYAG